MKYDQQFPTATENVMVSYKTPSDEIFKGPTLAPCVWCGQPTKWVSICYEASICSEVCMSALDLDYLQHERRAIAFERAEAASR